VNETVVVPRYSASGALADKTEHIYDKMKHLNLIRYERDKKLKKINLLQRNLHFLEISSTEQLEKKCRFVELILFENLSILGFTTTFSLNVLI